MIEIAETGFLETCRLLAKLTGTSLCSKRGFSCGEIPTLDISFLDSAKNVISVGTFILPSDPLETINVYIDTGWSTSGNDQIFINLLRDLAEWSVKNQGL
jgi:hypothetical protein